ncbi:hypothetical protein ABEX25_15780 [Paenibacillus thiaminolyticus]|uniref:hypothetical protein n=1 Tax=Paenibacillus thiaminolyticus TaxID=49283 RepID=UPI003D26A745
MSKPRMLWVCPHTVLRYEEIPLFIDAGAEIIPSLGKDRFSLEFDPQYDNELDSMYPDWRQNCTMPTHVVEKIRRIDLLSPSAADAAFFNQWIDAVYVASFPDWLERILHWFHGAVIYRTFGDIERYTDIAIRSGIDLNVIGESDNYAWAPILKCLSDGEDARLIRNTCYLPAFVSKSRLPLEWEGSRSERKISTLISYIHKSPFYATRFTWFDQAFYEIDYIVLGRNEKSSPLCQHPNILGNVSFDELLHRLCRSRLFCYGGAMIPTHLHFTPLEAMVMKVPMLFLESGGLAREALENGVDEALLRTVGMCKDYDEMAARAKACLDDISFLQQLSQLQQEIVLPVFSRERALQHARHMVHWIRGYKNKRSCTKKSGSEFILSDTDRIVVRPMSTSEDMPEYMGEYRRWSTNYSANVGVDLPGIWVEKRIGTMSVGSYVFAFTFHFKQVASQPAGRIIFHICNAEIEELLSIPLTPVEEGIQKFAATVDINAAASQQWKRLFIAFNGRTNMELLHISIHKLSDTPPVEVPKAIDIKWGDGFSYLESDMDGNWRWCAGEGSLILRNNTNQAKKIEVATGLMTAYGELAALSVFGELWNEHFVCNWSPTQIVRTLQIPPGEHTVYFTCNAEKVVTHDASRTLVFRLLNFRLREL